MGCPFESNQLLMYTMQPTARVRVTRPLAVVRTYQDLSWMASLKSLAGRFRSASGHHLHSTVSSSLRLGEAPIAFADGAPVPNG